MAYFDKYGVEYSDDRKTLVKCPKDFKGEYVIPDGVTIIGNEAFRGCSGLTSIKISNSVTSIEEQAFCNCECLISVVIGSSVTCLREYAFAHCYRLTSVTIPDSVTSIGKGVFYDCCDLSSVVIGKRVTSFGDVVFWHCDDLNSIVWKAKNCHDFSCESTPFFCYSRHNKYDEDDAFWENFDIRTQITSFVFGDEVEHIPAYLCYGLSMLSSIIIPHNVTSIGDCAFICCNGLNSIVVENSNPIYHNYDNCNAIIETASNSLIAGCQNTIIPDSVTSIWKCAFYGCTGLASVSIPNSVTSIGEDAFWGCSGLTAVTISNSVTSIGRNAFYGCIGLTSVTIPNNVISLGNGVFDSCSGLKSITIPNSIISIGEYAFYRCNNLCEIYVPLGQEERFFKMKGLLDFCDIIRKTSEKQKAILHQRDEEEQRRMQEQQMQEMLQDSILFFDTETTGVPRLYNAPVTNSANWPRLVQIAWIMADKNGNILKRKSVIIKPDGYTIPQDVTAVHGISTERAQREGQPLDAVLEEFMDDVQLAANVVGHNIDFDMHIVGAELYRLDKDYGLLMDKPCTCTMKSSTDFCAIPNPNSYYGGYKWPSLQELYRKLFNRDFSDAHDALADITATKECFFELKHRGIV